MLLFPLSVTYRDYPKFFLSNRYLQTKSKCFWWGCHACLNRNSQAWEQRWKKGGSCVPLKELKLPNCEEQWNLWRNRLNPVSQGCATSPGGLGQVQRGTFMELSEPDCSYICGVLCEWKCNVYQFLKQSFILWTDLFGRKPMIPQS